MSDFKWKSSASGDKSHTSSWDVRAGTWPPLATWTPILHSQHRNYPLVIQQFAIENPWKSSMNGVLMCFNGNIYHLLMSIILHCYVWLPETNFQTHSISIVPSLIPKSSPFFMVKNMLNPMISYKTPKHLLVDTYWYRKKVPLWSHSWYQYPISSLFDIKLRDWGTDFACRWPSLRVNHQWMGQIGDFLSHQWNGETENWGFIWVKAIKFH